MLSKKLLSSLVVGFIMLFQIANAQERDSLSNNKFDLQISAIPGFANFDYGNLSTFLEHQGLPKLNKGLIFTPSFGISMSLNDEDVLIATAGFSNTKRVQNNYHLQQEVIYGEIGYRKYLFQKQKQSLFLEADLGSVWYHIFINSPSSGTSFNGEISKETGEIRISSKSNQYVGFKTGYDWYFFDRDFSLGIRLGYRIGLGKEKWSIKNQAYSDSPKSSAKGFFLGLSLSYQK